MTQKNIIKKKRKILVAKMSTKKDNKDLKRKSVNDVRFGKRTKKYSTLTNQEISSIFFKFLNNRRR